MATKKWHTGLRNGDLFCFNCGQSHNMNLPKPVKDAAEMMKAFDRLHRLCPKTWVEPVLDVNGKTEYENADWWRY
jgi:nitrate/TMAO reductase-like tetraheme cytochrome c subunit